MVAQLLAWLGKHHSAAEGLLALVTVLAMLVAAGWQVFTWRAGRTGEDAADPGKLQRASTDTLVRALLSRSNLAGIQDLDDLRRALIALKAGSSRPDTFVNNALLAAANGHTDLAEAMFAEEAELREQQARDQFEEANRLAAVAHRHHGSFAALHDTKRALSAYQRATELDPRNPEGWDQLGRLLMRIGDFDAAFRTYSNPLDHLPDRERMRWRALGLNQKSAIHRKRGDLSHAEALAREALQLSESIGYEEGIAAAYGNLGNIYKGLERLDEAEDFHRKALQVSQKLKSATGIANAYGNLGNICKKRRQLAQAERYFKRSLEVEERLGRKEGMAADLGNLAEVFELRGKLRKARNYYERAYSLNEQLDRKEGQAIQLFNLGLLDRKLGNVGSASELLGRAARLFDELGAASLADRSRAELRQLARSA